MRWKNSICSILFLLPLANCYAQLDTNYIYRFPAHIAVEFYAATPTLDLNITNKDTLTKYNSTYSPYMRSVNGFGFSYRGVSLSYGWRSRLSVDQEQRFGKSSYRDFGLRINGRKFFAEATYKDYRGFSDLNTQGYDTSYKEPEPYIKRWDLRLQYGKLRAFWIWSNKKFSYKSAFSFSERQKKSKATILVAAQAYRLSISSDSGLLNPQQYQVFHAFSSTRRIVYYGIGAGPGFAANLVFFKKCFFFIGVTVGADLQYQHYLSRNGESIYAIKPNLLADSRVAFGYNGNHFYTAFTFRGDVTTLNTRLIDLESSYYSPGFVLGVRLKAPKIFDDIYYKTPLKYL